MTLLQRFLGRGDDCHRFTVGHADDRFSEPRVVVVARYDPPSQLAFRSCSCQSRLSLVLFLFRLACRSLRASYIRRCPSLLARRSPSRTAPQYTATNTRRHGLNPGIDYKCSCKIRSRDCLISYVLCWKTASCDELFTGATHIN